MEKNSGLWGELEENIMLIPLILSIVLTLIGFLLGIAGNKEATTLFNQLSYYCYSWLCCLGIGCCVHNNRYLRINLFGNIFPDSLKKAIGIFNEILGMVLLVALFVGSFFLVRQAMTTGAMDSKIPTLPLAVAYFAPLVGFALGIVRNVQRLMKGGKAE